VNSECTHIGIDKQLVKDKRIQTRPIKFLFRVYNADETKNRDITKVALLKVEINKYKEYIKVTVIDLNETDIFLGHN